MIQRLLEGTLDLAIMYRPGQPPGLTIEHLFDEEFVLVTSVPAAAAIQRITCSIDWGPDFQAEHAAAYPDLTNTGVNLDLGLTRARFPAANEASGYFPRRLVSATSTAGACASPPARAPSAIPSTWSIRKRATRRPTSRSCRGLRRAAERLMT